MTTLWSETKKLAWKNRFKHWSKNSINDMVLFFRIKSENQKVSGALPFLYFVVAANGKGVFKSQSW